MSMRYKGSVISATPPVLVTDAGASGAWTLEQQMQAKAAGKWPKNGPINYVETVFSTYLYDGTSTSQIIDNGINLASNGGLTWIKNRNNTQSHFLIDSARGISKLLNSNNSFGQGTDATNITSYNSNGFTVQGVDVNASTYTYDSWTFRKQPKFFDVVTYTGNGVDNRQITHNLGSAPGCVIVKKLNGTTNWSVYHRSSGAQGNFLILSSTGAVDTRFPAFWGTTPFSSTTFSVSSFDELNSNGNEYVAYLFAHDAGGFGPAEDQNVISCGSCVSNGSGFIQPVNLGYEPQWIMIKRINSAGGWFMLDTLRGMYNDTSAASPVLFANLADAEVGTGTQVNPTATGFQDTIWGGWGASNTYIYIAVRRGPMAVPTLGTKVFNAIARSGVGAAVTVTGAGFTPDWIFTKMRSNVGSSMVIDRLRGSPYWQTNNTSAEASNPAITDTTAFSTTMDGFRISGGSTLNNFVPYTYINYLFKRAPSFFDEVCYSGNSTQTAYTHNLGVVPQMIIVKVRNTAGESAPVWSAFGTQLNTYACVMEGTNAYSNRGQNMWGTNPAAAPSMTATTFRLGDNTNVNETAKIYVAYLFATCAGVSKVGSYTGTGATQAIACGFTSGSRFVLIKRIDAAGDWYYWDSVRGIVAGDDPYLLMNSTALEVTNTDYIDTSAAGFEITSTAPAEINAVGGSYIFLAVA